MPSWPARSARPLAVFDVARALAAFAVLAAHARTVVFLDAPEQPGLGWAGRIFFGLTGLGHQAVVVFFVVSGALVTRSMLAMEEGGWSARRFAVARLTRLWVVLLPCLVLGGLYDRLGLALVGFVYGPLGMSQSAMANRLGGTTFFANLLFLQGPVLPTFGSNAPLWTLSMEAWCYGLGFVLFSFWRTSDRSAALSAVVVATSAGLLLGATFFVLFPLWLTGAALAVAMCRGGPGYRIHISRRAGALPSALRRGAGGEGPRCLEQDSESRLSTMLPDPHLLPLSARERGYAWPALDRNVDPIGGSGKAPPSRHALPKTACASAVLFALMLAGTRLLPPRYEVAGAYGLACATAAVLLSCWGCAPPPGVRRAAHVVAGFSYSLYLSHLPLLALLAALVLAQHRLVFGLRGLAVWLVLIGFATAQAILLWWMFERHTARVRTVAERWIATHMQRVPSIVRRGGR